MANYENVDFNEGFIHVFSCINIAMSRGRGQKLRVLANVNALTRETRQMLMF